MEGRRLPVEGSSAMAHRKLKELTEAYPTA